MAALYTEQTLSSQTAYAQLLDAALGAERVRGFSDLQGSFNEKTVKGRKYWYFQFTDGRRQPAWPVQRQSSWPV